MQLLDQVYTNLRDTAREVARNISALVSKDRNSKLSKFASSIKFLKE